MPSVHYRQQIRAAVVTTLTGNTDAGARVEASRLFDWTHGKLPGIAVYTTDETVDSEKTRTSAPRELEREVTVVVEGVVTGPKGGLDNAMDALALQIEAAMNFDTQLGNADAISDSWLDSTELLLSDSGERLYGCVRLNYTVRYYSYVPEAGDPQAGNAQDLNDAPTTYNLGNLQSDADTTKDDIGGFNT